MLCFLACLPGSLFADERQPSDALTLNGYFSSKYVYRTASDGDTRWTDKDAFGELRLDAVTPKNGYEFHFFGTIRADLTDNRNVTGFYPLEDVGDAYDRAVHGYLYEAHLDVNNALSFLKQIRIGRQSGTRDESLFFDGLAMDISASSAVNLTLYGGAAVHLYELGNHWGDDALGGAGLDYAPFTRTRISLDYLAVNDDRAFPTAANLHDRMASLRLWQSFGPELKTSVKYRYLNNEPRDVAVRMLSDFPEAGAEVNVNYFRQFRTQDELSNELSLFQAVIGQSSPYQSLDAKARKLFGDHFAIDLGHFRRALIDDLQVTYFDRDFSRSFLVLELLDLPLDGLSFTATGDQWRTSGRDFHSAGFDLGYASKKKKNARINIGNYYSLYKYDYYVETAVKEKVRTYYLNARYPLSKSISANVVYEYEYGIERYQTGRVGLRYDF